MYLLGFILYFLLLFSFMVIVVYFNTKHRIGIQTANRAVFSALAIPVFLFSVSFLMVLFGEEAVWTGICAFYVIGMTFRLLSWPIRKKEGGAVLLNVGKVEPLKTAIYAGLGCAAFLVVIIFNWLSEVPKSPDVPTASEKIRYIAFAGVFSIYAIGLGLRNLEFSKNGICYGYSLIKWKNIRSFGWEKNKPNTLIIHLKSFFTFFNNFNSMIISSEYRDSVDSLLREKLLFGTNESLG